MLVRGKGDHTRVWASVRARTGTIAAVVAIWGLGLGALVAVMTLDEREYRTEHAPSYVAQVRQQLAEIGGLPFEAAPGHGSTPAEIGRQIGAREVAVRAALTEIEQARSGAGGATRLGELTTDYFSTIRRMLTLIRSGKIEAAGLAVARADRPGGVTFELRRALDSEDDALARDAWRARTLTTVGTIGVVVLALLSFSAALYRLTRSRGRAEGLAAANARLLELSRVDEERYRDLFENANEPIATVDLDWNLTAVNAAFVQALGYTRDDLLGTNLGEYLTEEGRKLSSIHRTRKLSGDERASTYEQTFVAAGGRLLVFEVSTRLIEENGVVVGIQGMCRDVTARKEAENELRQLAELNRFQAHHDALTGLPNRLHFHDEIERAIAGARRSGPFAVALIDIDRFKEINDSLGHRAGDVLLQEVATDLQELVRAPDVVARLGGDEFGVLLHGVSGAHEGWAATVERIKTALERPMLVDGIPVNVEASVGIAIHPTHGDGVDALLRRADVAMYVAKSSGRGHAVYTLREDPNDASKLALLGELRRGLAQHELTLRYQPIVCRHGAPVGRRVEALVRWEHPTHGLISPDEFLPLAERTGLIKPITLYVLEEAVRQCKQWERGGHDLTVSVNLSTRNLSEPDLVDNILRILADWKLDPRRLVLEITESAVIADPLATRRVLARLKEHGVKVAIDDFGAGSTSLTHLAHLPFGEVKIDRSFIKDLITDDRNRAVVRSVVTLSHDLGLDVVAEGVDSRAALDIVDTLGCDLVQGFYLSRPLEATELIAWLRDSARAARPLRAVPDVG